MDYRQTQRSRSLDFGPNRRNLRPKVRPGWKRLFLETGQTALAALFLSLLLIFIFLGGRYWWREMRWRFIVIHHTAADRGDLNSIRRLHMKENGWSDIAYHFVVDNGTNNTTMGQVEVSDLWKNRKGNLSTRDETVNEFSIAIVMVGNLQRHPPPPIQLEALIRLVADLSRRYNIPPSRIIGHRDVSQTACPGKYLNLETIRERVRELRADTK